MRVVIISPPKSGANRLRCLLSTAFGLRAAGARDAPSIDELGVFASWLGSLPDDSVTHTNLRFHPTVPSLAADLGVMLIAIIRHPFDLYLSNQEVRSNREQRANRRGRARNTGVEQSQIQVDNQQDPVGTFAGELEALLDWSTGAAITLRYEDILEHPETTLSAISEVVGSLDDRQIARAVGLCPAEQRIVSTGNRGARMTELAPGTWRTEIDPATLTQLQNSFSASVITLGYEPSLTSS